MEMQELGKAISKIGCLSFTTLDGDTMHSRIVHVCGVDDGGIYFLTMDVKPFYRQLKSNPQVSICGIYPASRATGTNNDGQPAFEPGYTLRVTGEVREVSLEEMKDGAASGNTIFKYVLEDKERYPAITLFTIHKGKGEIFDFDFEMVNRDHKVLRTRFGFGGETFNASGVFITDDCIACGECKDACTFRAIVEGEPYRVRGKRCDECGSCIATCPQNAIELSKTM